MQQNVRYKNEVLATTCASSFQNFLSFFLLCFRFLVELNSMLQLQPILVVNFWIVLIHYQIFLLLDFYDQTQLKNSQFDFLLPLK